MTAVGWPTTFTEEYVNQATAFQSQLTSLIAEGVFAKFPALTVVLMESGVTWLPAYLWRLTKFWKGLRSEIPWVSDPPSSIVRDRVRLTLQPFDAPPDPSSVMRLIDHIGSDEMLLFSTDYPHVEGGRRPMERFEASLGEASEAVRQAFYCDNFVVGYNEGLIWAAFENSFLRKLADETAENGGLTNCYCLHTSLASTQAFFHSSKRDHNHTNNRN